MPLNITDFINKELMSREEFEKYCFTAPMLDGLHGKRQLLSYNWANRFKIIEDLIETKPIKSGHKDYIEMRQQVVNSVISPLLLDMHSLYIQLLEEIFGICLSLSYNKSDKSFWYNYYFCENKNKDILPNDIYNDIKLITEATKNSSKVIQAKIDFKYVFLSDMDIFKTEKAWKDIKKYLVNLLLEFAEDLHARETYNHYKHRNRVITGKIPLKLDFDIGGKTVSSPLGGCEILQWFTREGESIKTNTDFGEFEKLDQNCIKLIELFLIIIKTHQVCKYNLLNQFRDDLTKAYFAISKNEAMPVSIKY
jgi:hypothetical protein